MDNIFTAFNRKISNLPKIKVTLVIALLILVGAGMLVGSFYTIENIEMLGILLGSFSGVSLLALILIASNLLIAPKLDRDLRHTFSISTRRKTAAVVALAAIVAAASFGDNENPLIGAGLIVLFGLLGIFISTTEDERTAIAEMEDEIVWRYENESDSVD